MKNVGIDFFPIDVYDDRGLQLIEAEFGLKGFAIVVKLHQKIHRECGYYCEYTSEIALLLAAEWRLSSNAVSSIVNACVRRGIFNKDLHDKYHVLTSEKIQTDYFRAVSRRKQILIKPEYLLVDPTQICKNVNIFWENVNNFKENVSNSEQSKSNTHSKSKRERCGTHSNVYLSPEQMQDLKDKFPDSWEDKINRLSKYMETSGRTYANHYVVILQWAEEDSQPQRKATGFTNFEQRKDYDYDALENRAFNKGADKK